MWLFSKKDYFKYYPLVAASLDLRNRLPRTGFEKLKVLNVGVGVGNSGLAIQLPYFPFARLDHVDVHNPYLEVAKARTWAAKKVNFINADIREIGLIDYDFVLMFDVLEHLPKADALAVMDRIKSHQIIFIPLETEFRKNTFGAESQDHLSLWTEFDFTSRGYKTERLSGFHKEENLIFDALWAIK